MRCVANMPLSQGKFVDRRVSSATLDKEKFSDRRVSSATLGKEKKSAQKAPNLVPIKRKSGWDVLYVFPIRSLD